MQVKEFISVGDPGNSLMKLQVQPDIYKIFLSDIGILICQQLELNILRLNSKYVDTISIHTNKLIIQPDSDMCKIMLANHSQYSVTMYQNKGILLTGKK